MSEIRNEVITQLLDKFKLLHLYPGKRDYFTYIMVIVCSILRCVQWIFAAKLIATNTGSVVTMAIGAKSIAVNFQVNTQIYTNTK